MNFWWNISNGIIYSPSYPFKKKTSRSLPKYILLSLRKGHYMFVDGIVTFWINLLIGLTDQGLGRLQKYANGLLRLIFFIWKHFLILNSMSIIYKNYITLVCQKEQEIKNDFAFHLSKVNTIYKKSLLFTEST